MSFSFKCKYNWYQNVYIKTDTKQHPWVIVGIELDPNGERYILRRHGFEDLVLYDGEFQTEVDNLLKTAFLSDDDAE